MWYKIEECLLVLGVSVVLYALARLLNYFSLCREDKGKDDLLNGILAILTFVLGFCSLPVSVSLGLIENLRSSRNFKKHEDDLRFVRNVTEAHCKGLDKMRFYASLYGQTNISSEYDFQIWVRHELKTRCLDEDLFPWCYALPDY